MSKKTTKTRFARVVLQRVTDGVIVANEFAKYHYVGHAFCACEKVHCKVGSC